RVGHGVLEDIVRKVLLTYWNTASFLTRYANAAQPPWSPERRGQAPPPAARPLLDRWVLAELHATIRAVDAAMEDFDTTRAGRRLAAFLDDLSNWYVRRARRRFWPATDAPADTAAFATLYDC